MNSSLSLGLIHGLLTFENEGNGEIMKSIRLTSGCVLWVYLSLVHGVSFAASAEDIKADCEKEAQNEKIDNAEERRQFIQDCIDAKSQADGGGQPIKIRD